MTYNLLYTLYIIGVAALSVMCSLKLHAACLSKIVQCCWVSRDKSMNLRDVKNDSLTLCLFWHYLQPAIDIQN